MTVVSYWLKEIQLRVVSGRNFITEGSPKAIIGTKAVKSFISWLTASLEASPQVWS